MHAFRVADTIAAVLVASGGLIALAGSVIPAAGWPPSAVQPGRYAEPAKNSSVP